ncbi:ASCH domain-containing protein [Streptomyces hygroscopicus]|uniref:ASCH domain-containing protein n=1 Tax=Streptomyces hygroscopicus TaxID=1912 RepID=A0ABQ3UFE4_STRHY|nr:ASCH domain-containing protein [Streptomyces hygroscopicus]GHJ34302.1 hypothetical protein TPA0910_87350 [Streptomyces hygroscopicus]
MKALTVRQPYADAIIHGTKRVENRTQRPPADVLGRLILIHAGLEPHASGVTAADFTDEQWPDVRGAIIGMAKLTGCHLETDGCCVPWGMAGHWHWELDKVSALRPVPAKGKLGLWNPEQSVLGDVQVQFWDPCP